MDSALKEIQPNPHPIPSDHHRKIELQSHADLTYLQQNLAKAAREKLDLHFPPIHSTTKSAAAPATIISLDGTSSHPPVEQPNHTNPESNTTTTDEDEDPLRTRVRHLIDQFLQKTHTAAQPSISVNGIDASSLTSSSPLPTCSDPTPTTNPDPTNSDSHTPTHEIEGIHYTHTPFDPSLQKTLSTLHATLESLTAQVSKLRREAPQRSAKHYTTNLTAAIAGDEHNWLAEQTRLQHEVHMGLNLVHMRHGWNEDVKEMYDQGTSQLAVLSGAGNRDKVETGDEMQGMISLTETVGRVQRARNVAAEFE